MRLFLFLILTSIVFSADIIPRPALADVVGQTPKYTAFGDTIMATRIAEINASCVYSVDPEYFTTSVVSSGSITSTSSMCEMNTGASAPSAATMITRDYALYRAGYLTEFLFTARWDDGTCHVGLNAVAGMGDAEGSAGIGCITAIEDHPGGFSVYHNDGTTDVLVPQAEWNIDKALAHDNKKGFVLDISKINIFRISYAWLGTAPITIEVYGGYGIGWVPLHVFNYVNVRTTPHLKNPTLPMLAYVQNTTNTTPFSLFVGSWHGGRIGAVNSQSERQYAISTSQSISGDTFLMALRVNDTFNTLSNHIDVLLKDFSAASDGTKNSGISVYKSCFITGVDWDNFDSVSSVTQTTFSVSSYDCSSGTQIGGMSLGKQDSDVYRFPERGYRLRPSEYVIFEGSSASASDIQIFLNWSELF